VSNSVLAASSVPCAVDFPMSPLRRDRKDSFYGPADSVFSTMTEETLVKADWIPSSAKGLIRRGFFGPRAVPPSPLVVMEASRAGHGSVRVGFGPFGHPTRAHPVWNFPTRSSKENVKTGGYSGGSVQVFLVGLVGGSGIFLGDFQNDQEQKKI
jgi:hypothetical protein